MILLIDNTKNLKEAFMTPKLLSCLEKSEENFIIALTRTEVNTQSVLTSKNKLGKLSKPQVES